MLMNGLSHCVTMILCHLHCFFTPSLCIAFTFHSLKLQNWSVKWFLSQKELYESGVFLWKERGTFPDSDEGRYQWSGVVWGRIPALKGKKLNIGLIGEWSFVGK